MPITFNKSLLDNIDVGIIVYDKDGWVQFVNATHLKTSFYTYEDFAHFNTYEVTKSGVSNICLFDKAVTSRRPSTAIQHTYHGRDGSSYTKLVTAIPILDKLGNITNVVSTFIDLNEFEAKCKKAQTQTNITFNTPSPRTGEEIVYRSQRLEQLLATAKTVASTDIPVLLTGESGTGKDLMAHFIHNNSPRSKHEMVVVDCASLPEHLLEGELFGYEKGAFTGATSAKQGLIEMANGGTLFLDEINSMPIALQGKLLRVLETQQVKRIGALKSRKIDFRIITATNADLNGCIQNGTFRKDLFYRLNAMPISMPPLRERREDVVPLCERFLADTAVRYGKTCTLAPAAYRTLEQYDWPGNVRELKNFIERLVITSNDSSEVIDTILPELLGGDSSFIAAQKNAPHLDGVFSTSGGEQKELETIISALYRAGGNRTLAAQALGVSRRTLQYKLKRYNIRVAMAPRVYVGNTPVNLEIC